MLCSYNLTGLICVLSTIKFPNNSASGLVTIINPSATAKKRWNLNQILFGEFCIHLHILLAAISLAEDVLACYTGESLATSLAAYSSILFVLLRYYFLDSKKKNLEKSSVLGIPSWNHHEFLLNLDSSNSQIVGF